MPLVKTERTRPGELTSSVTGGVLIVDPIAPVVVSTPPKAVSDSVDSIIHVPRVEVAQALQYVEGTSWSVDYYSQILTSDTEVLGFQSSTSGVTHQYTLIRSLEIKLQGSMSATQDQATNNMSYTGSAIVYAGVIPNKGDAFVANMENGSPYLFKVTAVEKKQVFKEAVYDINFEVQGDQEAQLVILNNQVAKSLHFMKEYLAFGKNPVLQDSQYQSSINAQQAWKEMLNEYMNMFFSDEKQTLIVPGKNIIYDPYVIKFIREQFDTHHHPLLSKLRFINIDEDFSRLNEGLYNAVSKRDAGILRGGFTMTALKSTALFAKNPRLMTAYHLNLEWVTTSMDHRRRVDETIASADLTFNQASLSLAQSLWQGSYKPYTVNMGFYPVSQISTYVFSEAFYKQKRSQMKPFESVVYDYITRTNTNLNGIKFITSATNSLRHQWSDIDTFYLLPLLIVIVRDIAYNPTAYSKFDQSQEVIVNSQNIMNDGLGSLAAEDLLAQWAGLDNVNVYDYFNSILNNTMSM